MLTHIVFKIGQIKIVESFFECYLTFSTSHIMTTVVIDYFHTVDIKHRSIVGIGVEAVDSTLGNIQSRTELISEMVFSEFSSMAKLGMVPSSTKSVSLIWDVCLYRPS